MSFRRNTFCCRTTRVEHPSTGHSTSCASAWILGFNVRASYMLSVSDCPELISFGGCTGIALAASAVLTMPNRLDSGSSPDICNRYPHGMIHANNLTARDVASSNSKGNASDSAGIEIDLQLSDGRRVPHSRSVRIGRPICYGQVRRAHMARTIRYASRRSSCGFTNSTTVRRTW